MELWAMPYLSVYIIIFLLWLVKTNRTIMFWLYLWQLKEYHWGRLKEHFATAKGRSIFLNPFFLGKTAVLAAFCAHFFLKQAALGEIMTSKSILAFALFDQEKIMALIAFTAAVFFAEAAKTVELFFKRELIHPELTKKSVVLIAAGHLAAFILPLGLFLKFLGEMNLMDLAFACGLLLLADILMPLIIGLVVIFLQPLTVWEKNKIIKKAKTVIAGKPELITIAVTGSYGKSLVKELLAHILSKKYQVLKTPANQNTEMGVAQTIIRHLKPKHQIFVCEIGAVHKGKIRQTAQIASPKIGIITGINQQHLGVFGSQKNIIDAKFELIEALPESGTAILNFENKLIENGFESKKKKINAANFIFAGKDIRATGVKASINHLSLDIGYKNQNFPVRANARGEWMAPAILLASAGALAAGMDLPEIAAILNQTDFNRLNIETSKTRAGINVVSSTYSANPDGVLAHLDYLKLWPGKKAIIMPCLIELGKESKTVHFEIGKKIAQTCDLAVVTAKERYLDIKKGALAGKMNPENIIFCDRAKKIKEIIQKKPGPGGTVLLEGRLPQVIIDIFKN